MAYEDQFIEVLSECIKNRLKHPISITEVTDKNEKYSFGTVYRVEDAQSDEYEHKNTYLLLEFSITEHWEIEDFTVDIKLSNGNVIKEFMLFYDDPDTYKEAGDFIARFVGAVVELMTATLT